MHQGTVEGGDADLVRVEFTPTSSDGRFGVFQLFVQGVPLGDGSTTAWAPHYRDLADLSRLAKRPRSLRRRRLALGDTFDHLDLHLKMTRRHIIFTVATRPVSEWGSPPPWAPAPGCRIRLVCVLRDDFLAVWRSTRAQFEVLRSLCR